MRRVRRLKQIGASAGVLSALLLIAGDIVDEVGSLDPYSHSAAISRMFIDNRVQVLASTYLLMLGVFFLCWFVAYLHGARVRLARIRFKRCLA